MRRSRRGGHGDEGDPGQSADDRGQRALHPGHHDEAVGVGEPSRTPSTRCSPATPTSLISSRRGAEDARGRWPPRGRPGVRRAGRDDGDAAARAGQRAEGGGAGRSRRDRRRAARSRTASSASVGEPGGEHGPVGVGGVEAWSAARRRGRVTCRRRTRPRGRRCGAPGRRRGGRSRGRGPGRAIRGGRRPDPENSVTVAESSAH